MACSNCYNGCTEIVSDKCVKYTGVDVPVLGIQNGDSLSYVEQALIEFLTSTLDGTGIKITIDPDILCPVISDNLPTCGDLTAVDLFNALIKAACFIEEQVLALEAKFAELEQGYTIDCLEGSPDPTSTYEVLQAVINKLCALEDDLAALAIDVDANYVKLADLDTLIQAYLDNLPGGSNQNYLKMVPYTAVEYYGPLSNFDSTGKGLSALGWDKIYLCNGANGTPDKRGRSPIGAIQGVPSSAGLSPIVDPTYGNFNYDVWPGGNSTNGTNTVTLTGAQIPLHTHPATAISTVSPNPHTHTYTAPLVSGDHPGGDSGYARPNSVNNGTSGSTTLTVDTTVNVAAQTSGGGSHPNVHPVLACYYIIYLP
jgi:hypothetical protein